MVIRQKSLVRFGFLAATLLMSLTATAARGEEMLKFEVYQDAAKGWRWRLVEENGKVLATGGQSYKAKADCTHGVQSLHEGITNYTFETYEDKSKEYRWRAKASNGQVVAASGSGYKSKADAEGAIEKVKHHAGEATIADVKPKEAKKAETKKAEPKSEPKKTEPKKAAGTKKTEPKKAEPKKTEPKKEGKKKEPKK